MSLLQNILNDIKNINVHDTNSVDQRYESEQKCQTQTEICFNSV